MKNKILFPVFLAVSLLMAGCSSSTIVSRPSWIDDKIIENIDTKDNKMKLIYDAIKKLGDTNSNVLNKILFEIAKKSIGSVEELETFGNHEFNQIDKTKLEEFINLHPIYKPLDNFKVYLDESEHKKKEECTHDEWLQIAHNMIHERYNELIENIYEKLFEEIKGGSYSTDNLFYEERYVMNLRKNLYDLPSLSEIAAKEIKLHSDTELVAKKRDRDESWKLYVNKFLNVIVDDEKDTEFNSLIYGDYIKRKIVPDIYRTYLIQTYVRDQRYSTLGRTYTRKVNMITIPRIGVSYDGKIESMLNRFVKHYINTDIVEYDFSLLEIAMRGIVGQNNESIDTQYEIKAYDLLAKRDTEEIKEGFDTIKIEHFVGEEKKTDNLLWQMKNESDPEGKGGKLTHVFKGTKLGDLVEKVQKVYDFIYVDRQGEGANFDLKLKKNADMSIYNEITNSGAYSFEHGLALKERDIRLTNYTKEGWYLKNGGLTDLDNTYRENLFNIATSNIIDDINHKYEEGDFVRYFGEGRYYKKAFLTATTRRKPQIEDSIILDSKTNYMIIEVEDAVSTSKLSTDINNTNSYRWLKAGDSIQSCNYFNNVVTNVVKAASTGDTYKKNANQYYLMASNILFHDQAIYDYFKSQYPDLFK